MGLESREKSTFVTIVGGKFAIKANEGDEGAKVRAKKDGSEVWEKYYESFTGKLTKAETHTSSFNGSEIKSWWFHFEDDIKYILSLNYSDSTSKALLTRLPNINQQIPITVKVYEIEGRKQLGVYCGSDKVAKAFTKESPNGMPPMEKKRLKGKDVWDDYEQMEFLEGIAREFNEKMDSDLTAEDAPKIPKKAQKPVVQEDDSSDLPF